MAITVSWPADSPTLLGLDANAPSHLMPGNVVCEGLCGPVRGVFARPSNTKSRPHDLGQFQTTTSGIRLTKVHTQIARIPRDTKFKPSSHKTVVAGLVKTANSAACRRPLGVGVLVDRASLARERFPSRGRLLPACLPARLGSMWGRRSLDRLCRRSVHLVFRRRRVRLIGRRPNGRGLSFC